jgi:hypothetical protein
MDTPPPAGLSLTLTWSAAGTRRHHSLPLDLPARAAAALILCAASYQFGRWAESVDSRTDAPRSLVVGPRAETPLRSDGTRVAPGGPVGEPPDVITPLNARDPSALIMGPGAAAPPPAAARSVSPPAPPSAPDGVPDVEPPPRVYKNLKDIKPSNRF